MSTGESGFRPPPGFRPPSWARDYDKHHPLYSENWNDVVRGTAGEGAARYHPSLTLAEIERMEIDVIAGANQQDQGQEIPDKCTLTKRVYWKCMNRIVGASRGKQTEYIFVEYAQSGDVHGRPIDEPQLKRKGAKL